MSAKTVCSALVYDKAFRLSNCAWQGRSIGEIQNLMGLDAKVLGDNMNLMPQLFSAPVFIMLLCIMLGLVIGPSFTIGPLPTFEADIARQCTSSSKCCYWLCVSRVHVQVVSKCNTNTINTINTISADAQPSVWCKVTHAFSLQSRLSRGGGDAAVVPRVGQSLWEDCAEPYCAEFHHGQAPQEGRHSTAHGFSQGWPSLANHRLRRGPLSVYNCGGLATLLLSAAA